MFKTTQTRLTMTTLERRDVPAALSIEQLAALKSEMLNAGTVEGAAITKTEKSDAYGGKEMDVVDSKYGPRSTPPERHPPIKFSADEKVLDRAQRGLYEFIDMNDLPSEIPMTVVETR